MSIHVKKRHRGMHFDRTKKEPLERAFAVAWQELNETSRHSTLEYMFAEDNNRPRDGEVSERDQLVANTVIQWLGSPVGQCFLGRVATKVRRKAS
jgi:hypothetical protein